MIYLILIVLIIIVWDIKPILKDKKQRNSIYVFIGTAVIVLSYGYYYFKNSYDASFVRIINKWFHLDE